MLSALNVIIKRHISGLLKQEQETKQKQNSLDAQSASIHGESIVNQSKLINKLTILEQRIQIIVSKKL